MGHFNQLITVMSRWAGANYEQVIFNELIMNIITRRTININVY